ncbi:MULTISPECIES: helix-turn-helix transcriptional regulator [Trichocoleus]|uniref:Helix-turn-helix transcriptional regulator n=1 Tax=Trichocoleus desertorum GB2-A4 TaxID=2933944 RepID=A0ABV0JCQ5_9CYAN|nr:helix-turn-helix transcriptional regulator [Trichocoleus sp. FACHB-46]MBD1864202.1 helix-turn-helix transcriptional regulator [Trichocoleus sp. FACHB-46]
MVAAVRQKSLNDRRFARQSYGKPKSDLTLFGIALRRTFDNFPELLAVNISAAVRASKIGKISSSQISGFKNGNQNLRATSVQDIIIGLREEHPEAFEYYLSTLMTLLRNWEPTDNSDQNEAIMPDYESLVDFIKAWMEREGVSQEELEKRTKKEGLSAKALREILAGREINTDKELAPLSRVLRDPDGKIYDSDVWNALCGDLPPDFSDESEEPNGHTVG